MMLKEEQSRLSENYQSTFSNAVAVQVRELNEVQGIMQSVVESLDLVHGGLEEVSTPLPHASL